MTFHFMFDLSGKKGIVTAASSGIGAAVARVMSKSGVELLISSSNSGRVEKTAGSISKETGNSVSWEKCDMKKPEDVENLAEHAVSRLGKLDFLVINYGDPRLADFLDLEEKDWNESIQMFIGATVSLVRKLVPHMNSNGGRIVFITSMTTRQAYEGFSLSGSLRAAVVNLGKILSLELAPRGLTVNSISQGYFLTERLKGVLERNAKKNGTSPETELEAIKKEVPVRRIGEPEEIGYLVAFLCSDEASYINGANVPIDGGITTYPY